MTIQQSNKGAQLNQRLNLRHYRLLHIKGIDPKAPFPMMQEDGQRRFEKHIKERSEGENKTLKTTTRWR
jgi:hypothetical protein